MLKLTVREGAVTFAVRALPRASRSEILGELDGALKVRLAAPPVEGAANEELVRLLAKRLGVPRRQVTITAGATSRHKLVRVDGLAAADLEQVLARS
ncbi:MAG TPA: DUF167 domain-containing protein [Blastocatellia bacterium]|nr:DUF167 domain-containing protein [Blastocatellia bacterium]